MRTVAFKRATLIYIVAFIAALSIASVLFSATAQTAFAQDGALTAGNAAIAAQDDGQGSGSEYAQIIGITLNKTSLKIKNDGKKTLRATLIADDSSKPIQDETITWTISKPKIASITQEGVVQGKKAGTATVTATTSNGLKATAKVKVTINKKQMAKAIPVLTYHRITSDKAKRRVYNNTNLAISASLFNRQMKWLKKNGYRTISTAEFRDWRVNGTFLPKKSVLITIDDGFYETYHIALPILKKYNLKATSFVIGGYTPKKTSKYDASDYSSHYLGSDVIKKVRRKYPNLEFQSHTFNMHHRSYNGMGVATTWSRKAIDNDFKRNKKYKFTAIAYPFGHTSRNLLASVRANKSIGISFGYMMDWPATRTSPLYNIPRFKVFGDRGMSSFKSIVRTAR